MVTVVTRHWQQRLTVVLVMMVDNRIVTIETNLRSMPNRVNTVRVRCDVIVSTVRDVTGQQLLTVTKVTVVIETVLAVIETRNRTLSDEP